MKALIGITQTDCSKQISEILNSLLVESFSLSYGDQLNDIFNKTSPNFLIIDSQTLKSVGLETLQNIKKRNINSIAVILVDLENSTDFLLQAYDSGIDDFVNWPFVSELFTRKLKALTTRILNQPKISTFYPALDLEIFPSAREARINGQDVDLTATEFKILSEVANETDTIVSRNLLLDKVFGTVANSSRTMDVHIHNLRKKLAPLGLQIETIRSVGCKLKKMNY